MKLLPLGLISELAASFVAKEVRQTLDKVIAAAVAYLVIAVLGLIALAFVYVLAFEWLAESLGGKSAAAILIGVNLVLIGLVLAIHALSGRRRRSSPSSPAPSLGLEQAGLEAGLALGSEIGAKLRKATPQIVFAAAMVGFIVGIRPEILTILTRRKRD